MIFEPLPSEAEAGYLRAPSGRGRHVQKLDQIVQCAHAHGIEIFWTDAMPSEKPGWCEIKGRKIFLNPLLMEQDGWYVRHVVLEEIGHCLTGSPDDADALRYVERFWRKLVRPDEIAEPVFESSPARIDLDILYSMAFEHCDVWRSDIERIAEEEEISCRQALIKVLGEVIETPDE